MKKTKKLFFVIFFLFLNLNYALAEEKIAFVDMEKIVKNSNYGKSVLSRISDLNNNNIKKLKKREQDLKDKEESIKKKQNILSEEELNKEINQLKIDIKDLRNEKDEMVVSINKIKNKELNNLYQKINPIIQSYMDENDISILLDVKSIVFGKSNHNITTQLVDEINNKLINIK